MLSLGLGEAAMWNSVVWPMRFLKDPASVTGRWRLLIS